jgi:uncharacterized protein YbjT (DUF2867 family)
MNVLIIGATGGTGRWLVRDCLAQRHQVTAFVRNPDLWKAPEGVRVAKGDARDRESLDAALSGQDAVLSAFGPRSFKPEGIQETLMRNLVDGMNRHGVRRLINLSALGMGDSAHLGPWLYRNVFVPFLLKGIFEDKARGENILYRSKLEYVNVRPGRLLNSPARGGVKASLDGQGMRWTLTREDLAAFMVAQLTDNAWVGKSPLVGY